MIRVHDGLRIFAVVQTKGVSYFMDSHLEEINPIPDIPDSPGLGIVKMNISGYGALLGQEGMGQSATRSIKWIMISMLGGLEPAGEYIRLHICFVAVVGGYWLVLVGGIQASLRLFDF